MPKLILLNGGVAVGKTTITQRYLDEHPLTLGVHGDNLIAMLGQWLAHEAQARKMLFAFTKSLVDTQLQAGHDVILPYLMVSTEPAEAFEALAKKHHAQFYEILLDAPREDAIQRALQRGTWGEPGSPPLTAADQPIVEDLYDRMMQAIAQRPQTIKIASVEGNEAETYRQFLAAVS